MTSHLLELLEVIGRPSQLWRKTMKRIPTVPVLMAAGLVSLTACEKSSTSPSAIDTAQVTADVAASSGDAIAVMVSTMSGNEVAAALPAAGVGFDVLGTRDNNLTFNRVRTCLDANKVVVAGCTPMSSVREIDTHVSFDGSRTFTSTVTGGSSVSFTGAVHRVLDDTLKRNFDTSQPPVETSRTHIGRASAHDTSSYAGPNVSRFHAEAAHDSVNAVTWNLPRSTNPWPVSGSIVRSDSVHSTFTDNTDATKNFDRKLQIRIEVDFPADAQGNVVLKINDKTCNLNLVTHRVTGCQ
jgi:hypothetical protein